MPAQRRWPTIAATAGASCLIGIAAMATIDLRSQGKSDPSGFCGSPLMPVEGGLCSDSRELRAAVVVFAALAVVGVVGAAYWVMLVSHGSDSRGSRNARSATVTGLVVLGMLVGSLGTIAELGLNTRPSGQRPPVMGAVAVVSAGSVAVMIAVAPFVARRWVGQGVAPATTLPTGRVRRLAWVPVVLVIAAIATTVWLAASPAGSAATCGSVVRHLTAAFPSDRDGFDGTCLTAYQRRWTWTAIAFTGMIVAAIGGAIRGAVPRKLLIITGSTAAAAASLAGLIVVNDGFAVRGGA
jgi:hypothetical protein